MIMPYCMVHVDGNLDHKIMLYVQYKTCIYTCITINIMTITTVLLCAVAVVLSKYNEQVQDKELPG